MPDNPNREPLYRALDAFNRGDLDAYLELYHPDIRLHGYGPAPMDKTTVRDFYGAAMVAFPGTQLRFEEEIADGDRWAIRFTQTGVHKAAFMGIPGTDRPFSLNGQTVLHFQDGQVIERWSVLDLLGFMAQVGAMPPMGGGS